MSPKVLHLLFNKLCLKMIDPGSRSTWGSGPSRSGLQAQKYDPPPLNIYIYIYCALYIRCMSFLQHVPCQIVAQNAFKNVSNCLKTNIYSYLEASSGQSSNPYLNVVHFFQHQSKLEICGNLRKLFSSIGA